MYKLSWHSHQVLQLSIKGDYTIGEVDVVNELITKELDNSRNDLLLLIDVSEMNRPYNFAAIRDRQTFKDHESLKHIYIVSSENVIKLAMMVIFHLSRAQLSVVSDMDKAIQIITKRMKQSY